MTSPNYTSYSSMVALPAKVDAEDDDVVLHNFADDLEVVIHPMPVAKGAPAAAAPAFKLPSASPPTPPASGAPDPNVDYNRVLLPMKPGNEGEQGQRPHILAKKDGVEYLEGGKRERFHVETGYSMRRNGAEFDTTLIKAPYLAAGSIGFQELPHATQDQIAAWAETSLIWVCAVPKGKQSVQFYSHVCRPGKFHHSSLTAGGTVVGAGEWIVRGGKLARISANSGHYQPTIDFLYRSVLHLADTRQPDTTIFLYDSKTQTWVDRPWADFISSPTDNGRYWTHPNAELK
jgi:hypothetical protein